MRRLPCYNNFRVRLPGNYFLSVCVLHAILSMRFYCSSLSMISRMGVPRAMGGTFSHLKNKKFSLFQTRKFSKNFKNQWKIYNFLKIVKEILRFFEKVFKILSKFSRKFREQFRKLWKYAFVLVRGRSPPS